jgi:hypothetical protein
VVLIFKKEKQMATKTRIYAVTDTSAPDDDGNCPINLVRASTKAQAVNHIAASRLHACVASQELLVSVLAGGATVEDAGEELVEVAE